MIYCVYGCILTINAYLFMGLYGPIDGPIWTYRYPIDTYKSASSSSGNGKAAACSISC